MKIAIIGAGGVGGYFGGKIAEAGYPVTFIARGEHLKAIQTKGLEVKSINGNFKVYPKASDNLEDLADHDLIILAVKAWQVLEIAKQLKSIIKKSAMVLPLQNGADNVDQLLSALNLENVMAGLSRIVSKIEAPGVINHFAFEPQLNFGEVDNRKSERMKVLKQVFDKAGFKNVHSEDIHLDIWRKFLFIATIGGIASLTRVVFGIIRSDEMLRKMIFQTALEIKQVANAKGVQLTDQDIDKAILAIDSTDYNTTASMQRDIMAGRPSELSNFNGYIDAEAKKLGLVSPLNSFIYYILLPQEKMARGLD